MRASVILLAATFVACATSPRTISTPAAGTPTTVADNDRDPIVDTTDKCPTDLEVFNGVDDTGCREFRRVVQIGPCKVEILDKILFAKNAAALPAEATSLLDAIARTMELYPQILSLEVQGHATRDERGPDRLARARASAVLEYLATKRVARERLVLGAYAAEHPAPRGKWESALVLSRRVEFSIRKRTPEGLPSVEAR